MINEILAIKEILFSIKEKINKSIDKNPSFLLDNRKYFTFLGFFLVYSISIFSIRKEYFPEYINLSIFLFLIPIIIPFFFNITNSFLEKNKCKKDKNPINYFIYELIGRREIPFSIRYSRIKKDIISLLNEEEKKFIKKDNSLNLYLNIRKSSELIFDKVRNENLTKLEKKEILDFIELFKIDIDKEKLQLLMDNKNNKIELNSTIIQKI